MLYGQNVIWRKSSQKKSVEIGSPKLIGFHIVIRAENEVKNNHIKKIKFCIFLYLFSLVKPQKVVFFNKRVLTQL